MNGLTPAILAASCLVLTVQAPQPNFQSGIELVPLWVAVRDASNRPVSGLTQADFAVFEDDVRQQIAYFSPDPQPLSLGIVLDMSGSMQGERQAAALDAVDAILTALTPADESLLHVFNDGQATVAGWASDKAAAVAALRLAQPQGGTQLYRAVVGASDQLRSATNRKRALIVITDGRDNSNEQTLAPGQIPGQQGLPANRPTGWFEPQSIEDLSFARDEEGEATKALQKSETLVYSVGIDWPYEGPNKFRMSSVGREHPDAAALRRLTDATGGVTFIAAQPSGLLNAAREITEDLRHQYTIAYSPQRKPDGKYRRIRVATSDRAYVVRSRQGYVTMPRPAK